MYSNGGHLLNTGQRTLSSSFRLLTSKLRLQWTRGLADDSNDPPPQSKDDDAKLKWPEPPNHDLCCQSGCEKCVWIEYALELERVCNTLNRKEIQRMLDDHIEDASLRSFVQMQLRLKQQELDRQSISNVSSDHQSETK